MVSLSINYFNQAQRRSFSTGPLQPLIKVAFFSVNRSRLTLPHTDPVSRCAAWEPKNISPVLFPQTRSHLAVERVFQWWRSSSVEVCPDATDGVESLFFKCVMSNQALKVTEGLLELSCACTVLIQNRLSERCQRAAVGGPAALDGHQQTVPWGGDQAGFQLQHLSPSSSLFVHPAPSQR